MKALSDMNTNATNFGTGTTLPLSANATTLTGNLNDNFNFNRDYYNQFGRFVPFDFINQVIPVTLKVTGQEVLDVHLAYFNGTNTIPCRSYL
jgi:hypothetical protein